MEDKLKSPSQQTLDRYGLSLQEWLDMAQQQDQKCFVCQKYPRNGRICVDHLHVKRLEENATRREKEVRSWSSLFLL